MVRGATIFPASFLIVKDDFFRFRLLPNAGDGRAAAAKLLWSQDFAPRELNPTFLLTGAAAQGAGQVRWSNRLQWA
jgi:hypothetical protein